MSDMVIVAIISAIASFAGSFFGFKVKLGYIDRDLGRHHERLEAHDTRIRQLEIGE